MTKIANQIISYKALHHLSNNGFVCQVKLVPVLVAMLTVLLTRASLFNLRRESP